MLPDATMAPCCCCCCCLLPPHLGQECVEAQNQLLVAFEQVLHLLDYALGVKAAVPRHMRGRGSAALVKNVLHAACTRHECLCRLLPGWHLQR
jgi:hypothetical protein